MLIENCFRVRDVVRWKETIDVDTFFNARFLPWYYDKTIYLAGEVEPALGLAIVKTFREAIQHVYGVNREPNESVAVQLKDAVRFAEMQKFRSVQIPSTFYEELMLRHPLGERGARRVLILLTQLAAMWPTFFDALMEMEEGADLVHVDTALKVGLRYHYAVFHMYGFETEEITEAGKLRLAGWMKQMANEILIVKAFDDAERIQELCKRVSTRESGSE